MLAEEALAANEEAKEGNVENVEDKKEEDALGFEMADNL